jgi:hypothetical protein
MTAAPFDDALDGVDAAAMTIVYGGVRWYLDADSVRVHPHGEDPRAVAPDALPLPVARVLQKLRRALASGPSRNEKDH